MSAGLHPSAAANRPANVCKRPEDRLPEHSEPQQHKAIILLSACPRSGSNYLENLLALHPHCRKSKVPEDFFLANSETLLNFCRSVADSWDDWWLQRLGGASRLAMHVGTALLRFADPGPEEEGPTRDIRLMLRSPTTEGIAAATTLFPDAKVLVLVRDGPPTVESGRRSFGWPYEEAMLAWRQSVRRVLSFLASADGARCQLIRFEDLTADPAREIARVIAFLGLDPALYPSDRVDEIPVFGSSSFGRTEGEGVHWRPVPKDSSFDPLARAQSWPAHRLARFAWLAGAEQRKLGYRVHPLSPMGRVWSVVLDGIYGARRIAIQIALLPLRAPRVFSDRRRRYFSWRRMSRPGDAVQCALRNRRRSQQGMIF
ncbi:MAG: sulfotransferase [Alphaproteobacteria bacterium]|nr:MAG: sulfotransferase [Alphaproteobacteria bacterium]